MPYFENKKPVVLITSFKIWSDALGRGLKYE
jgi:hypothetical protein